MIVHEGADNLKFFNPVVTLGIFDGVHKGHRALLDYLVSCARNVNGESVVVTFHPHPRVVLTDQHKGLSVLTTLSEKKSLLEKTNLNHLIILTFDRELGNLDACDFVEQVLVKKIGIQHLIVGYDHHFGKRREGDIVTIKECAAKFNFSVEQVNEVCINENAISSTAIREALLKGKIEEANSLLGYNYSLTGVIVEGRRIGREIGYPTANISPDDSYKLIPCDGVYAVEVNMEGTIYYGMLSIGSNPTVNDDIEARSVEVNIFDFEGDIYGSEITVIFRFRLRDEIRFKSIGELTRQMDNDKQHTMRLLK